LAQGSAFGSHRGNPRFSAAVLRLAFQLIFQTKLGRPCCLNPNRSIAQACMTQHGSARQEGVSLDGWFGAGGLAGGCTYGHEEPGEQEKELGFHLLKLGPKEGVPFLILSKI